MWNFIPLILKAIGAAAKTAATTAIGTVGTVGKVAGTTALKLGQGLVGSSAAKTTPLWVGKLGAASKPVAGLMAGAGNVGAGFGAMAGLGGLSSGGGDKAGLAGKDPFGTLMDTTTAMEQKKKAGAAATPMASPDTYSPSGYQQLAAQTAPLMGGPELDSQSYVQQKKLEDELVRYFNGMAQ